MFKDKKLKAIKFINAETGEIYAMIDKDSQALCQNDYVIILDYSEDNEKTIIEKDDKFYELAYVKEEDK